MAKQKYVKRDNKPIVAVQLDLKTTGFAYEKWGSQQLCKSGDWLVNNAGETYTIDQETFAQTYRELAQGQGLYVKIAAVWAERALESGKVQTKEGFSEYQPGDYLVCNQADGGDAYCVGSDKFEAMYRRAVDEVE